MPGPLHGVRVIDLTTVVMGPYATQILGDYGADVIKVEPPDGDIMRVPGPARHPGMGHVYLNANRNKRGIVLDLKHESGRAALLRLARDADVLVYNVRPQAMKRLRLGYEDIRAVNPRIVYAGAFGFGQQGPYAERPAFDDLIQAMSGAAELLGRSMQGPPRFVPVNFCDRVSGLQVVNVILAALFARERTGQGQAVDLPMFEAMAAFMLGEHLGGRSFVPPEGPMGYARITTPFRRPYATRDGYLVVLPYNDKQFAEFLAVIERPDLATDPRYATTAARAANVGALYAFIEQEVARRTSGEWLERLGRTDLPHTAVLRIEDLFDDPHLQAVGFFTEIDHPTEGRLVVTAVPSNWSATQPSIRRHAPALGEHTVEVLREAGFSDAEIDRLLAEGAARGPKA